MAHAEAQRGLESAITEVERLRTQLRRSKQRQVRAVSERSLIKATAQAWFNNHKPASRGLDLNAVDELYGYVLSCADRNTTREHYVSKLALLKKQLIALRDQLLRAPPAATGSIAAPDFAPLVTDPRMRQILEGRWTETQRCLGAHAHLAATVMMGGLLEALLLARVHRMPSPGDAFKTKACPKDKAGKPVPLQQWTLADYIDVAHELGWIARSARDVSAVMRDYRNYVHPYKELSHGVTVLKVDTDLMWAVLGQLVTQILAS